MDTLDDFVMGRPATATRPLLGLTVLVVEDSRYASEALRLLCLRSGARIRRADSLDHARRHLKVYRPGVVIVDLGLPDGDGTALIADLAVARPRIEVILGMSGDADAGPRALAAGADGFLAKPVTALAAFQAAILAHLPADRQPPRPTVPQMVAAADRIEPDPIALRDDLAQVAQRLTGADADRAAADLDYLAQFLGSLARTTGDADLARAVTALVDGRATGLPEGPHLSAIQDIVQTRLAAGARF